MLNKGFVFIGVVLMCWASSIRAEGPPHRLIVLTDMGADPDDQQSLVRLLLYSNEIDIEGLIATTSVWQRETVRKDLIDEIVSAYGKIQPNLMLHAPGYPCLLYTSDAADE